MGIHIPRPLPRVCGKCKWLGIDVIIVEVRRLAQDKRKILVNSVETIESMALGPG
jgi:hypothetical protein